MSKNLLQLQEFRRYLDPHVYLQLLKLNDFKADQQTLQLQRLATLVNTRLIDQIEREAISINKCPLDANKIQGIKLNIEKLQKEILTKEVNDFLSQLSELNTVEFEQFTFEQAKAHYPYLNDSKNQNKKLQILKHLNEKVVGINASLVENACKASALYYDLGQYEKSLHVLDQIQYFLEQNERFEPLLLNSYWGRINLRLVTQILDSKTSKEELQRKIQLAFDDIRKVNQILEQPNSQIVLKQKADLLHYSLLLTFISPEADYDSFLDQYGQQDYQKVLFTLSPQLLNYYSVALLMSKNYESQSDLTLESLSNLLDRSSQYKNSPLLEFLFELLVNFDFEKANSMINQIQVQSYQDFLLSTKSDSIVQNAKMLLFNTYIKIFNHIDIKQYAKFLGCSSDDAEVWLVNAIRSQNLPAKIDSDIIKIDRQHLDNQTDQILTVIKDIVPKTQMLITNLDRFLKSSQ